MRRIFFLIFLAFPLFAFAEEEPSHVTAEGSFKNPYVDELFTVDRLIEWVNQVTPQIDESARKSRYIPASVEPDLEKIHHPDLTKMQVTWIGHATFLVQMGGLNILTDPMFSDRASPLSMIGPKRFAPPGLSLEELPPIDLVLISHNHYDHLDEATVLALGNRPVYAVPLKLKEWFISRNIHNVIDYDWWQTRVVNGLSVTSVPAQHWSNRGLTDMGYSLWSGWVVSSKNQRFYFAGDTGFTPQFREIVPRLGKIDVALIPIGAYEPRWATKLYHISPDEAVELHKTLNARTSIGMHWGTFMLTAELPEAPPIDLAHALKKAHVSAHRFITMKFGETREF